MSNTTRQTGRQGENAACNKLISEGYTVIEKNYTVSGGEIDIIAEDEKYIVFVEVKYRTNSAYLTRYGRPVKAITHAKKQHFVHAVKTYLSEHPTNKKPRIDVMEIIGSKEQQGFVSLEIKHYKNAFGE